LFSSIISRYIDDHAGKYIDRLAETVAIASVSADPDRRPDVVRMMEWAKAVLIDVLTKFMVQWR
jgi:hypothetical protein